MDKNRVHAIIANAVESGGSFSPSDREKFAQTAREHGIEGSVIEEVIDIGQTIVSALTRSMFPLNVQKMMEVLNNNKDGSR
ncbi:hypothetical protein KVM91_03780 [Helicobacter pylori]|nr:hypothetical protein KVM91_03780 [Helicobacter pylori]